ncbi:tyrosine-type recombinase/integrase [Aeromonas caviae]|uniref:tyrosine-type recombinase/integrase n=1 Tax=Aeromonas caviae TaxID=648 RepID=UPI002B4A2F4F|nr:site-specific integrase [Aeromonas caviae]
MRASELTKKIKEQDAEDENEGKLGTTNNINVGDGLYLRRLPSGTRKWVLRYTNIAKKRVWFTIGSYPHLSLAQARGEAARLNADVENGKDPSAERKRDQQETIKTVEQLFLDWYQHDVSRRLKHPQIPKHLYQKEIAPHIGKLALKDVNARDIRAIIHTVANSGRNATANDALMVCKQLFKHAIKLNLLDYSPAQAFTMSDAGGQEKSRKRILSLDELDLLFTVLRKHRDQFVRENYLAIALLVHLGVRKGELIAAMWSELDFDEGTWCIPAERSKTATAITIPLSAASLEWFAELKVRACGSPYVFPSRRASKRRDYISDDTLNHAIAKLFGQKVDSKKQPLANVLGEAGLEHFTIHDLRRTCRSLLASIGIPSHVAERCLNHKLKGVEGIYNRHDYLDERREALEKLADILAPIVDSQPNVVPFISRAS